MMVNLDKVMAVKRMLDLALHRHSIGEGEGTCRLITVDENGAFVSLETARQMPELACMMARLWLNGDIWMCDVRYEHCEWQAKGSGKLPEEAASKAFWAACGRLGMNFNE